MRFQTVKPEHLIQSKAERNDPSVNITSNVIQRTAKDEVSDYFFRLRKEGPDTLYLYSYIYSDGYGDAGQLGFLKNKIDDAKTALHVNHVVVHAIHEPRRLSEQEMTLLDQFKTITDTMMTTAKSHYGINFLFGKELSPIIINWYNQYIDVIPDKKEIAFIKSELYGVLLHYMTDVLTKINAENKKFVDKTNFNSFLTQLQHLMSVCNSLDQCRVKDLGRLAQIEDPNSNLYCYHNGSRTLLSPQDSLWEIQYPVPDPNFTNANNQILKINEMNHASILSNLATGTTDDEIGYGIPTFRVLANVDLHVPPEILKKAWLVSIKPYADHYNAPLIEGVPTPGELDSIVLNKARAAGIPLVIFAGRDSDSSEENSTNPQIRSKKFQSEEMRSLMNQITEGAILSGGEGMFAESLGRVSAENEKDDTASVLTARYQYQYTEIGRMLLTLSGHHQLKCSEITSISLQRSKFSVSDQYVIFQYNDEFVYCEHNPDSIFQIIWRSVNNNNIVDIPADQELIYGTSLSALWFPLSINAYPNLPIPKVLGTEEGSAITCALSFFNAATHQLKKGENNWFNLIESGLEKYRLVCPGTFGC